MPSWVTETNSVHSDDSFVLPKTLIKIFLRPSRVMGSSIRSYVYCIHCHSCSSINGKEESKGIVGLRNRIEWHIVGNYATYINGLLMNYNNRNWDFLAQIENENINILLNELFQELYSVDGQAKLPWQGAMCFILNIFLCIFFIILFWNDEVINHRYGHEADHMIYHGNRVLHHLILLVVNMGVFWWFIRI